MAENGGVRAGNRPCGRPTGATGFMLPTTFTGPGSQEHYQGNLCGMDMKKSSATCVASAQAEPQQPSSRSSALISAKSFG
jgi:hypothetical protein